jgi:hypothetical protein
MSSSIVETAWKVLWLVAASLIFAVLLALIAVSVDQAYVVVVKSLLISTSLTKMVWFGALTAAIIPFGFLTVYSCLAFIVCGQRIWKLVFRK